MKNEDVGHISILVFVAVCTLALIFTLTVQGRQIKELHRELVEFRQEVVAMQDTLLVNVKRPVWWR